MIDDFDNLPYIICLHLLALQVLQCKLCQYSWKAPGYIKKSKEVTQPQSQSNVAGDSKSQQQSQQPTKLNNSLTKAAVGTQSQQVNPPEKRKFSFLNKTSANSSSNAGMKQHPLSVATGSNDWLRRVSAPPVLGSHDFISFNSNASNTANSSSNEGFSITTHGISQLSQSNQNRLNVLSGSTNTAAAVESAVPVTMNLLELEKLNKKKRRKTLGSTGAAAKEPSV